MLGTIRNRIFSVFDEVFQTQPDMRYVLAVSGGADSLSLLLLVDAWCADRGVCRSRFFVASVDHGLRCASYDEACFVVRVAQQLGFNAQILSWDGEKPTTGIQAAARDARYSLLADFACRSDAAGVVTAHTCDDQIETFFMRLFRGSGVRGLGGMRAQRLLGDYDLCTDHNSSDHVVLLRPFLAFYQSDILSVSQPLFEALGVTPVQDPSNQNTAFERVRVRQMVNDIRGQGFDFEHLPLSMMRLQQADDGLYWAMQHFCCAYVVDDPRSDGIMLETARFIDLPRTLQGRVIEEICQRLTGSQMHLSAAETMLEQVQKWERGHKTFLRLSAGGAIWSFGRRFMRVWLEKK